MATRSPSEGGLYSSLAFDPDLAPLVELFVDDLPDRAEMLLDRLQASDYEGLRRLVHQMYGAAGSYGFQPISDEAAVVERTIVDEANEEDVCAAVNSLIELLRRARSGLGEQHRPDAAH